MGEIKSALEIALEKTENIHSNNTSIDSRATKNKGKKSAGDFLASGNPELLLSALNDKNETVQTLVTEGIITMLLASIQLPATADDIRKTVLAGLGLETVLPQKGMKELFGQVEKIFGQYIAERDHLDKALEQQFLPRLRAKQQEMEKRYGQTIPMELTQDAEYQSARQKNRRMLEQKYEAVILEVRSRVKELAGIEE